jgi:PAS domain S-box-containing protein
MVLVTVAVLVFLLRRMVHAPLGSVVGASRRIVDGDLTARASVSHAGEFGLLASQVNRMTDHLARSLSTVEAQRRELQEILEAVDDEIVVLDRAQRVVAANRAFGRGCGHPDGDFSGRLCREASGSRWPCAAEEPDACPVRKVFLTGQLQKGIMSRTNPDGSEQVIEIHASPLRGSDGEINFAVEVRRDISERRQLQASLAHSERLASLGLLATGISHEINNPLGAIAASVEGLRRRLAAEPGALFSSPEALDQALLRIADQVRRGRTITERLLKVARPPGGTRTLVDVNGLVEDILSILSHQIRSTRVSSRLDLASGLPPLPGDGSHLGQVVMNLALNAIQAMEAGGGEIRIATSLSDGAIQLEIQDTGCGIPPEHLARIYEPFFTTKPPGKGTGLGLFITHRIVTDLGGTIQVRSEPGRGTTFTVRLPRRPASAES